ERAARIRGLGRGPRRLRWERRASMWRSFRLSARATGGRLRRAPLRAWRFRSGWGERRWGQRVFGRWREGLNLRRVGGPTPPSGDGVSLLLDWVQVAVASTLSSWKKHDGPVRAGFAVASAMHATLSAHCRVSATKTRATSKSKTPPKMQKQAAATKSQANSTARIPRCGGGPTTTNSTTNCGEFRCVGRARHAVPLRRTDDARPRLLLRRGGGDWHVHWLWGGGPCWCCGVVGLVIAIPDGFAGSLP